MIGEKLVRLRRQRGMTQLELARLCHTSCKSIKNWESDISDPNLENFVKLCAVFNVTADSLLGISDDVISLNGLASDKKKILQQIIQVFFAPDR